jgi:hypothetical protein
MKLAPDSDGSRGEVHVRARRAGTDNYRSGTVAEKRDSQLVYCKSGPECLHAGERNQQVARIPALADVVSWTTPVPPFEPPALSNWLTVAGPAVEGRDPKVGPVREDRI